MLRLFAYMFESGAIKERERILNPVNRILCAVFMGLIFFGLLARGSASPLICSVLSGAMGSLALGSLLVSGEPKVTLPIFRVAIGLIVALVGWVFVQTLPVEQFANPAWIELSGVLATRSPAISVAPADSLAALVTLTLPFVVFIMALLLFPSDEEALRLLSYVALTGGAFALWAICEFLFSPHTLLMDEKSYYLDSLTAPFVNRNTASTFYGMISLILSAQVYVEARQVDFKRIVLKKKPTYRSRAVGWWLGVYSVLFICSLSALLLTKSRGGIGCTFIAYLFFVPVVLSGALTGRSRPASFAFSRLAWAKRLVRALGGFFGVILIGVVFADRALFRAEVQGLDDARFCVAPAILRAAADNQLTGVGFGTFRLFFPAYRDAQCGVSGVWDRAHSVYLEAYLGLGWVFLPVFLLGVGTLIWAFVRGVKARRSLRVYPILGMAILILVLAHSGVDFSLQIPGFAAIFAATLAGLVTISRGRLSPHS